MRAGYRLPVILLATAVVAFGSGAAPSQTLSVTVLLDFEQAHSNNSIRVMQQEAQTLLADAGISVDVRLRSETDPAAQFTDVVLFKMKGRCVMDPMPVLYDERGPLAEAYESDGQVLSFGEIRCDRVKASLKRTIAGDDYRHGDVVLGRALGRVLAHEMYHMLGNAKGHTKHGVTRESLASRDLTELGPLVDDQAAAKIRVNLKK